MATEIGKIPDVPVAPDGAPTCDEKVTFTIVNAEFDVICGRAEYHATWSETHVAKVTTPQGEVLFYWKS